MIIITRQKSFSEKKETDRQKSKRRKLAADITMIGAGIGSEVGIYKGLNDSKEIIKRANEKLKKTNAKDRELVEKVGERAEELVGAGKVDPNSMNRFIHEN